MEEIWKDFWIILFYLIIQVPIVILWYKNIIHWKTIYIWLPSLIMLTILIMTFILGYICGIKDKSFDRNGSDYN